MGRLTDAKTGKATEEARAHGRITCAEPRCPNAGTDLTPVAIGPDSKILELEFCPEHAFARSAVGWVSRND